MICIYGPTGVGKTVPALQSSPEPVMYIQMEPRSLKPSLDAIGREIDLDVAVYQSFPGLMQFVTNLKNFERHQSIIVDSYSHLMSIGLSSEIEDEQFEARP